ncbi:pyocin knob domain-containing protein [Sporolactobacillus shoreicorticis]|uniref:Pyocin knob domain-containing protein n=1 Tax=Sporolactobacillus shoreicorticis TaxID=1923877 RepID=A0ABW5S6S6_9BACL|nr:pyocin knob domain-containing protein [Sporolactobacillus shoreicorticis]MCO7127827.1 pyocin knob domain-containing protein [Sporolactobacillus shoreicorticis]
MPFTKPLPEWNAPGVEPPQNVKDYGWQAGSKPPADWFNWFFFLVPAAIKELQENGYTKDEIASKLATMQQFPLTKDDGGGRLLDEGYNLNTLMVAGSFIVKNPINSPGVDSWYYIRNEVCATANGVELYQWCMPYTNNQVFSRKKTSVDAGKWSPWCRLVNKENDFAASTNQNGYQKFPSGMVIQWGAIGSVPPSTVTTANFPISFPTTSLVCVATTIGEAMNSGKVGSVEVNLISGSQFRVVQDYAISRDVRYIAIGY